MIRRLEHRLLYLISALAVAWALASCGSAVGDNQGEAAVDTGAGFDAAGLDQTSGLHDADAGDDAAQPDWLAPPDAPDGPAPGEFLHPCDKNEDCFSGYCVNSPQGQVCSKNCEDDASCPDAWSCSQVFANQGDPAYICVPNDTFLCRPCLGDDDCNAPGFPTTGLCVQAGNVGHFCTRACNTDAVCPTGFACETHHPFGQDGPELDICVYEEEGTCTCTPKFVEEGAHTTCYAENEHGICTGQAMCGEPGPLSPCNAPEPAAEICNSQDDDCDGETDEDAEGCVTYYPDNDGDEYGQGWGSCLCQHPGPGWVVLGGDCNELVTSVHPGAVEVCGNGLDDNCDGVMDEEDALGCVPQFQDADGDGYGLDEITACLCSDTPGWAELSGDCNDLDPNVNPGAPEICNTVDDNCDGKIDETDADGCQPYFLDQDGDSYGLTDKVKCLCGPTGAYIGSKPNDCNDLEASIHPGVPELCNGIDDNCNGETDEGEPSSMCPAVAHGLAGCVEGTCQLIDCDDGWSDADDDDLNGCECPQGDLEVEGSLGATCLEPKDIGVVSDAGGLIEVTDNIAPADDVDWYKFSALDGADPNDCDSFDLHVDFVHNPQEQFAFDVYAGGCAPAQGICTESMSFSDSTNLLTQIGDELVGECPCKPGEDTIEGHQECTDQTETYMIRVYRRNGFGPSCSAYTLRVQNGL